jgi:xylulose-5-phosphate/fructose-6-phosphate phosphoketolase
VSQIIGLRENVELEGLAHFYPQYSVDKQSLHNLITGTPNGFPSYINADTPGAIREGGKLGYALSVAFGVVIDQEDHSTSREEQTWSAG